MSVFDSTTDQSAAPNTQEDNQSFVAQLVAARGEQWSNPETIAKGKLEADQHIARLEQQLKELNEDLGKTKAEQDYAKTLLETLQSQKPLAGTSEQSTESQSGAGKEDTTLDPSSLKELIAQVLDNRTAEQRAADNRTKVDSYLQQTYGTEAGKTVQEKAKELNLSVDYLKSIAEQSPNAFYQLIGVPKPRESAAPPSGSVNSVATMQSGERTYAYYRELRKTNPTKYYSPSTQQQMFKDAEMAEAKGVNFFDS